jgi:hypothetical protein
VPLVCGAYLIVLQWFVVLRRKLAIYSPLM